MYKLNSEVTDSVNFFMNNDPIELALRFGSPLYLYNEDILRKNCRELKGMCAYKNFRVNFSVKANTNLTILRIARQEGLDADAMSAGEIYAEMEAGFKPEQILFIANNVSDDEMKYAIERGILVSADSLSQLERLGRLNPGGDAAVRLNPGIGAGHHEKVVTGGEATKFGINLEYIPEIKKILKRYSLSLKGVTQHIGSHFMDSASYLQSMDNLFREAEQFDNLDFIDLGGGFGIPYKKQAGEGRFDLKRHGALMDEKMDEFAARYGKHVAFIIEPGRYVAAEAGVLLGTVHAVKNNGATRYVGTDVGFNVLARPMLYGAHHDIEVYSQNPPTGEKEAVTVVGNICESGDIIAENRLLPRVSEGDVIGILDAGSYGYSMSSNYNQRLRPAEVLLRRGAPGRSRGGSAPGEALLIRARDKYEDLVKGQKLLQI